MSPSKPDTTATTVDVVNAAEDEATDVVEQNSVDDSAGEDSQADQIQEELDDDYATYPPAAQARLYLSRIDPWAVLKTAFVISIGLAIVIVVAIVLVWGILAALGIFSTVNEAVESVAGSSSSVFNIEEFFSFGRVLGSALVLAVLNVVLVTLLACLFAFMYNLTVPFTRGIEVTLTEE